MSTAGLQTLNSGDQLDGGDGTDEMFAVVIGSVTPAKVANIESVTLTNTTTASTVNLGNASGITSLTNQGSTVGLTISGIATTQAVTIKDTAIAAQVLTYSSVTGTSDSATVGLSNVTGAATLTVAGVETITLNSTGSANTLADLIADSVTTLNITGDKALTFTTLANATATTIDASTATGAITLTAAGATASTITGGAGNDAITRAVVAVDSISAGAGNDRVTFATGALTATDTVNGGDGTDDLVGVVADLTALTALTTPLITNFEEITVSDALAGNTLTTASVQAGISTVELAVANAGASVITFEAGTKTVKLTAGLSTTGLTVNDTGVATTDSLTIANNGSAVDALNGMAVAVNGFETVNITTSGTGGAATQQDVATITLAADSGGTTTLNISGSNSVVTTGAITANVIDASGLTGSAVLTMGAAAVGVTSITGSGNSDTLIGDSASSISGGAGNDVITGGAGNDTLLGGDGNDTITTGGGASDSVDGGSGNDTIAATLTAGNTIAGGEGTDILSLAVAGTAATASGVSGFETLRDTGGVTHDMAVFLDNSTFTKLQNAGVTSIFSNVGSGITTYSNTATGSTATITRLVDSTTNSLTVTGLTGTTLTALTADNEETINLASSSTGAITVGTLTATDLTTLNVTGSGAVTITTLNANSTSAGTTLTIDGSTNTGGVTLSAVNSIIKSAITGSATASNVLTGSTLADTITGGVSADTITGGAGADVLSGGLGTDTYAVGDGGLVAAVEGLNTGTATGIAVNLGATAVTAATINTAMSGTIGISASLASVPASSSSAIYATQDALFSTVTDTLSSFEIVTGTSGNDYFQGSTSGETLSTLAGVDYIVGGLGADTITGGDDADIIVLTETTSSADRVLWTGTTAALIATETGSAAGTDNDYTIRAVGDTVTAFASGTDKLYFAADLVTNVLGTEVDTLKTIAAAGVVANTDRFVEITTALADGTMGVAITALNGLTTTAVAIGDSFIAFVNDGTDGYLYLIEQVSAANTIAAQDVTLIGKLTGVIDVATGDFVSY